MTRHPFLSDDWLREVDRLVEAHGGADAPGSVDMVMNLTITETPFGAERLLHLGSTSGRGIWGLGHVESADVTLTTDYATAKEIFVSGDPASGMQAFMSGRVKVAGDMAKLLATQASAATGGTELESAIQSITE